MSHTTLRIVVHDFAGHPFQLDLSRELARMGSDVLHLYSKAVAGPKTTLDDAGIEGLAVEPVDAGLGFEKYRLATRLRDELRYGRLLRARVERFAPDVVVSANAPLFAQRRLLGGAWSFVHWWQDIQSRAARGQFEGTWKALAGRWIERVERRIVREADAVVGIAEEFRKVAAAWGADPRHIHVVPNWAPLAEIPELPRDNPWARDHALLDRPVFLYAGTLGLKHDPLLLARLAEHVEGSAYVVVVSEGVGADQLRAEQARRGLPALRLLPFQPFDRLPEVLASADVLLTLLEPQAGHFSVPSKVLSYLCAGRPQLLAVPEENLAARTVRAAGAGLTGAPGDVAALSRAADILLSDADERVRMGRAARSYAAVTFDTRAIAETFLHIVTAALSRS